ncbi:MAG: ABC transporter substrate-binding protein, partial [Deltaproteobacteria bacterium]|nr:ABC transporter substrate-binding protein [Deltaproteobacteria bacterium]
TWIQWYNNHVQGGVWGGPPFTIEYPRIFAWNLKANPAQGIFQWERNPYYWKVDAQGNQLPYLDTLRFDYVAANENHKVKLAQGEVDILGQHIVTMADFPFYKENATKGNYIVGDYVSSMGDRVTLFPQHTLKDDPGLTEIVRDYRWVQALSHAIDREEINQTLFYGTAKMGAMSPMPNSKYYKPEYGTAFAKFDKAAANKLLDDMGLKKGANGMRTRKDGSPLKYNIENAGIRVGPVVPKFCEMIVSYWREVGIDASTKEILEALYLERMRNSQVHCGVWHADRCSDMLFHIEPQWFIPTSNGGQGGPDWAWGNWYLAADKKAAGLVEPPEDIKKMLATFDKMTSTVDENERVKFGQEIFDYLAKNPLEIGTVLECPA